MKIDLSGFDQLPDSAMVPVTVFPAIVGIAVSTVWRRAKLEPGYFPQPIKLGSKCTRFRVGEIRSFMKVDRSVAQKRVRKTDIGQSELQAALAYDHNTGNFIWRSGVRRSKRGGEVAGMVTSLGYVMIKFNRSLYLAHRLAWLYVHGVWPTGDIDHINGIKTDNRIANLRDVPTRVNQENRRKASRGNTSGLLGVSWNTNNQKWVANIQVENKHFFLGSFDCKLKASEAYLTAKRAMHEGCTI